MIRRIYSSLSKSNDLDRIPVPSGELGGARGDCGAEARGELRPELREEPRPDHKHIDEYLGEFEDDEFESHDYNEGFSEDYTVDEGFREDYTVDEDYEQFTDSLHLSPVLSDEILSPITSKTEALAVLSPITSIDSYQISSSLIPSSIIPESDFNDKLERITDLPLEVLMRIVELVYYDTSEYSSIDKILENFSKVGLICKMLQLLSYKYFYKYGNFNRPHSFDRFLNNLVNSPHNLGNFVQFIDFESFTSIGLGRTGKMNQEIQMVTSKTILQCLKLTPNLIEFLASESIQDDLNVTVLNYLFNELPHLQALDFCGASSQDFLVAFESLVIDNPLKTLFKLSFHDCSNLTVDIFQKILPNLPNLRRLDLTHTSITSSVLLNYLPPSCNLTHLSLSRCSKLTTRDLINFLINHPAVNDHQLTWLNLSIDSNVVSPLTSNYLFFTLNHLNAKNLQYLNLKGLPITDRILHLIHVKFPKLVTLSIGFGNLEFNEIYQFLCSTPNLVHVMLTGNKLNKSNILNLITLPHLQSIEFDTKILKDLTNNNGQFVRQGGIIWRFFDNNGRRAWIYKLDPDSHEYQQISQYGAILDMNLTFYDLKTGKKIERKQAKPGFLKYVGRKMNCSVGFNNTRGCTHKEYLNNYELEEVWPPTFTERGIYNYYSLNI